MRGIVMICSRDKMMFIREGGPKQLKIPMLSFLLDDDNRVHNEGCFSKNISHGIDYIFPSINFHRINMINWTLYVT